MITAHSHGHMVAVRRPTQWHTLPGGRASFLLVLKDIDDNITRDGPDRCKKAITPTPGNIVLRILEVEQEDRAATRD